MPPFHRSDLAVSGMTASPPAQNLSTDFQVGEQHEADSLDISMAAMAHPLRAFVLMQRLAQGLATFGFRFLKKPYIRITPGCFTNC